MTCARKNIWLSAVGVASLAMVPIGGALGCASEDDSGAATWSAGMENAPGGEPPEGSNVSFGGSQDIGFLRGQLEAGQVPSLDALDDAGFFAEHHIDMPPPACGARICVQPMVAVMRSLSNGEPVTMLHIGLKSPIEADPAQRAPLDLAVVVDVSGSMQGQKLAFVQQGLSLLIDSMRDTDRLSLVIYSDGAQVLGALEPVASQRIALRRAVENLRAAGGTNIAAGLDLGYQQLLGTFDEEAAGRERRVILLSDGVPTVGTTDTSSILALSGGYNSEGIGLSTIGLGADFNIDLMRGLSLQGDGNFYFLEDGSAVDEVFEEELSFFLVPIALDLKLEVTAGESYDLARAYGAPLWRDTALGGQVEIPSVFIAHRESDDDVTADDGRRGGGGSLITQLVPRGDALDAQNATIANVALSFRDPQTDEIVRDHIALSYPDPLRSVRNEGYFEGEQLTAVHKSFVMLNIYIGIENAVTDYHAGRADRHTIAELDELLAAIDDYNDEIRDTDIELDIELLELLHANLLRAGVAASPATPSPDPWPCD